MAEIGAGDFPPGRWRGRFVWCEAPRIESVGNRLLARRVRPEPVTACFRRVLDAEAPFARVPARITADSRYALFVNGVEASRGPVRGNLRRLHYDLLDLAPLLRPGRNVLAVLVRFFGRENPWWAPAPPTHELGGGGLLFEARLPDASWIVSDASWLALRVDAWEARPAGGVGALPVEHFDARGLDPAWRDAAFDDSSWTPARELSAWHVGFGGHHEPPIAPYGALRPRPIAPLGRVRREATLVRVGTTPLGEPIDDPFEQALADSRKSRRRPSARLALPLRLPAAKGKAHAVAFDFGEVVAGTVVLEVDAPAGTRIDVGAAEFADVDGRPTSDDERGGFRYVARGRDDAFETLEPLGFRHLALSIRADGPVTLRDVAVHERLHPRPATSPESGPYFECDDPVLNQIWAVGRRSVDLNSHDAYLDCPTREQRAWTGDMVVHQMVDFASHPDWRLACWNVELGASPRPDGMLPMAAGGDFESTDSGFIPDWALHWVRGLHNVWRYTGDRDRVARLMPVAENVLRWFEAFQADDGLASDVTGWVIIDWSSVTVDGKSSVLNALWARGLADFAEMAEWLGDAGRARWARALHARIRDAFELFWDPERALYVDAAIGRERLRPVSQHALATPIAAGLVPRDRVARVVEVLLDEKRHVHATWSRASGDAREPRPGEHGVGGAYLLLGPPKPWWDVEHEVVLAQPFFAYVLHDALAAAGREDLVPAQCRRWAALLERCSTSWSETWYGGTVSHGWGSSPTRDLLVRTLGVTPAEPGYARARVAPRLGPLAWARGALPTPHGLLRVAVDPAHVAVESPVPFDLDCDGRVGAHPEGRHRFDRSQ